MRILLTSCGGFFVKYLIKEIKKDNISKDLFVLGVDENKIKKIKYFNKIYQVKYKNKKNYISNIIKICNKYKISLIVPLSDKESLIISEFRKIFSKLGIKILVNNYNLIKKIQNKLYVYKKIQKYKIRVPKYFLIKNKKEFKAKLKKFLFPLKPVVLKPISLSGGRGVIVLKSNSKKINNKIKVGKREKKINIKNFDLDKFMKRFGNFIMMEHLKKPSYDVDYFNYNKQELISVRERINPSGIPYKGNIVKNDKKIENYCKKIAKALNLKGLVDFDLMSDQKNRPVLLELNTRPSGSIVVNHLAGFKFFSVILSIIFRKKYKYSKKFKGNKRIQIK